MKKNETSQEWYRLDNAAKIYPSTNNSRWNAVYRCAVVLKSRVDREVLQAALDVVIDRYPTLKVALKKGFFWYYFQSADIKPVVQREENYPCAKFDIRSRDPLFRVLYSRNRISVEFFHSLTDGYGAVNFTNTLLLKYFSLLGKKIVTTEVLHYDDLPMEEEMEDSYLKYNDPSIGKKELSEQSAYHLGGAKELQGVLNVVQGEVATDQLIKLAKSYGVTVNSFVLGVIAYICYKVKCNDNKNKRKKPIKIQNAINLRGFLPSKSLRNFASIINIPLEEDAEEMTFEQVLAKMNSKVKEMVTKESMQKFINTNCDVEKKWYVRIVPLFLKTIGMKLAFYKVGEDLYTFTLSNMGKVNAPKEFEDFVDRYEFILGAQKYNAHSLTAGSFNNKTVFTFSRILKSPYFERDFFQFLSDKGLDVKVVGNKGSNKRG